MPDKATLERAKKDKREGKHGARSAKQAIAIGLSKARRAGVDLPPPEKGATSEQTRRSAASAYQAGQEGDHKVSSARSRAATRALKREGHAAASKKALSRHAHAAAAAKTAAERSAAARKAVRTKGAAERSAAARKAARTRARTRG